MVMATEADAMKEFASNYGKEHEEQEWLLSEWDTWEHNPHYTGKQGPHPNEEEYPEELDMTDDEFAKDFDNYMEEGSCQF